jgi:hypothetical protein
MDTPICNPSKLMQNLTGIRSGRLKPVSTPERDKTGTGSATVSMITKISFPGEDNLSYRHTKSSR